MKLVQSLLVASLGCILSIPVFAEETETVPAEELSGFSVSCGYQGAHGPKAANDGDILVALNQAAALCEAVENIDASHYYHDQAVACTESKSNCLQADYKNIQKSWCGHKLVQPIREEEYVPMHWVKTMETVIGKAKKACMASPDPVEVAAATAYFEDFKSGICTDEHVTNEALHLVPEACLAMYHALGANGAPY